MSAIAGRVLLIGKGEYSASVTYHPLDWVTYGSSSYCCKATTLGNLPTDTDYWQPMAKGVETPAEIGIGIGTCSTAASTVAKTATLTDYELTVNGIVAVTFTNAVPANATLNINSEGAKPIYYQGSAIVDQVIKAGYTATFAYDGANYVLLSVDKSAGHEIKNSSGTTMTQRSALKFTGNVTVTDDSTNDQTEIHIDESGHTIEKADGTDMPTRQNLQFDGAVTITDDSTNDRTKITIEGSGHTIEDPSGTSMTQRSVMQFADALVEDDSTQGSEKTVISVMQDAMTKTDFESAQSLPDGLYPLEEQDPQIISADMVGFDKTGTDLTSDDTEAAIKEVNTKIAGLITKEDITVTFTSGKSAWVTDLADKMLLSCELLGNHLLYAAGVDGGVKYGYRFTALASNMAVDTSLSGNKTVTVTYIS